MTKLSGRQRIHESRQNRTKNMDSPYSRQVCTEQGLALGGEGTGREGKGREEKRREGKGREGKGRAPDSRAQHCRLQLDGREASVGALTMVLCL